MVKIDANYEDRISKHCDGHALLDVHVQVWGWRMVMLMYQGFHLFCFSCRQWTAFLSAASTAGYVYLYSFYYFFFKTK